MNQPVLVDRIDRVATLTLNRPERHNSLTPAFLEQILAALVDVRSQPETRALILQANGRSFSTGGDVRRFYEHLEDLRAYAGATVALLNQVILELMESPFPVIAAVHGMVTGGSIGFVLASDILLVTPQASFAPYYSVVGYSPDGGWTALMPAIIGIKRTAEVLMHNRTITAQQALAWGLANQIVPAESLFEASLKSAQELAQKYPGSLFRTKALLRQRLGEIESGLQAEKEQFLQQITTAEAKRGMEAFLS